MLLRNLFPLLVILICLSGPLALYGKDVPIDGAFGYKLGEPFTGDEVGVKTGYLTVYPVNAATSKAGLGKVLVMTVGPEQRVAAITATFEAETANEAQHEVMALGDWLKERHGPSGFIRTVAAMKEAGTMAVLRGNLGVLVATRSHSPRKVVLMYMHSGVFRDAMKDAGLSDLVDAADAAQAAEEGE